MSTGHAEQELSPRKRKVFKVLAVAMSLAACLLCLEIVLRIRGPEYQRFEKEDTVGVGTIDRDGKKLLCYKWTFLYYSNPRGYFETAQNEADQTIRYSIHLYSTESPYPCQRRTPENINLEEVLAFLARDDTILALGDSFTVGRGVRYEDIYVRRLEKLLAEAGKPVTINNAAWPGVDIEEICASYDFHSARRRYPLVIYGFVLNDFGMPGIEKIVGSDYIDLNNCEYNRWRAHCALVNFVCSRIETLRLNRVTKKSYFDAFEGNTADDKFRLLETMNGRIRENDGKLVIVLFPLLYEFNDYPFQSIHDKIHEFCRTNDILLLDLLPAFSEHTAESLWVHPTDHHPNEIAHRIAAEEIYAFLKRQGLLKHLAAQGAEF
jgi:lysophospholipase L1-like esterase